MWASVQILALHWEYVLKEMRFLYDNKWRTGNKKVLAIMPNGKSDAPCGACRELMVQLMPNRYQEIEVLMDFETEEIVTLGDLTPGWWI